MLIFNMCRRGLMPNLIKKSWTVSITKLCRQGAGLIFFVWIRKHEICPLWPLALLVLTTSQDLKSLRWEASVIMHENSMGEGGLARSSLSTPSAAD